MRCTHALNSLSPFLDGQLPADQLTGLDRHLQDCPSCMAELNALRAADAVAQQAFPEEPLSPDFVSDLERRIAREGDLPQPAGGLTVRAIIPMAAAVLLGATVTFLGMQAGRTGRAPVPIPNGDGGTVEHAPVSGDVAEALDRTTSFSAKADVVLTNLGHLGTQDAQRELRLLQNEADAVGLEAAMADATESVEALRLRDVFLADKLVRALEGTDAVMRRLEAQGAADQKLLGARREILKRQLRELVRELAPNRMPRPNRKGVPAGQAPHGDDVHALWRAAFRHYGNGDLAAANGLFLQVAAKAQHRDEKARASFWVARTSLMDGKPHITLQQLPMVQAFSPRAAADLSKQMRVVVATGGATIVIVESEGGEVRMQIEGELDPDAEIRIDTNAVRAEHKKQMDAMRKRIAEMQRQMKREFEQLPKRQRTEIRKSFETAELPTPKHSHQYFRTSAVRVDGTEVPLAGAAKALRDTTPIIAYRIRRMRPMRYTARADGVQVHAFDVWDREQDEKRTVSRRIQFGSWEAKQFVEALQAATGKTLHDKDFFSTFKTIEFVVQPARTRQAKQTKKSSK